MFKDSYEFASYKVFNRFSRLIFHKALEFLIKDALCMFSYQISCTHDLLWEDGLHFFNVQILLHRVGNSQLHPQFHLVIAHTRKHRNRDLHMAYDTLKLVGLSKL